MKVESKHTQELTKKSKVASSSSPSQTTEALPTSSEACKRSGEGEEGERLEGKKRRLVAELQVRERGVMDLTSDELEEMSCSEKKTIIKKFRKEKPVLIIGDDAAGR